MLQNVYLYRDELAAIQLQMVDYAVASNYCVFIITVYTEQKYSGNDPLQMIDSFLFLQKDLIRRSVCSEAEADEIVNDRFLPLVSEQQTIFEKKLEALDVSNDDVPTSHSKSAFKYSLLISCF